MKMRLRRPLLASLLLLLVEQYLVEAFRETERRQLQEGIATPTGDFTVLAGTDYCCSNGLATPSATTAAAARRLHRQLSTHPHIGWTDPGDWVAYPVQLLSAGVYQVHFQVSSPFGDGGFELIDLKTQELYGTVDTMPVTSDWNTFETISLPVTLPAGLVSLQIRLLSSGWNLLWLAVTNGESGVGTLPVVIAPSPDVVVSPDEVTLAPSMSSVDSGTTAGTTTMAPTVTLSLDDVTMLPTLSTSSIGTGVPTPKVNVTSPNSSPKPVPTKPTTMITLSPVETPSVVSVPISSPVVAPTVDNTTKPRPLLNKRPFLHEFITAESYTRSSPTIVWEASDTEQRMQAAELKAGDWMEFELAIPIAGPYQVHVRASSPSGEGSFELVHVETMDDDADVATATRMITNDTEISLGIFTGFPATGTWDEYDRMDQEISLPASTVGSGLLMRINVLEPGFNLLWLYVEPSDLWDAIGARDDVN